MSLFIPYRLCLLGEHVDHQGGATLGITLDLGVRLDFEPSADDRIVVEAANFDERFETRLGLGATPRNGWSDYLEGVRLAVERRIRPTRGFRGRIVGEFPAGGVSSSAAVQIAYALALLEVNDARLSRRDLADLVVEAERDFVGVNVGYLDPMTILHGDGGALVWLRSDLSVGAMPWPDDAPPRLALIYSGVARRLGSSAYNDRIDECRRAAEALQDGAARLGDVSQGRRATAGLPGVLRRRAEHVFGEEARVARGLECWRRGDLDGFAREVDACGDSCVEKFETGTAELVDLVASLRAVPGVRAARFAGGGFGGAVFALIDDGAEAAVERAVREEYAARHRSAAAAARIAFPGYGRSPVSPALAD